jgi:hypothetical protein
MDGYEHLERIARPPDCLKATEERAFLSRDIVASDEAGP